MTGMVTVRFKRPFTQQFAGTDLEVYGPFQTFDVADIPEANAQVLEDLGYIEPV